MQIRRASRVDLPAIRAIESASFPDPWPAELLDSYFDDRHAVILVAEDPSVVGFVIARTESTARRERVLHIHDLAVAPAHRRRAVGSQLLAELIGVVRRAGMSRIQLEVRVENDAARGFYERHGFTVIRQLARYYDDGGAALRMELDLGQGESVSP